MSEIQNLYDSGLRLGSLSFEFAQIEQEYKKSQTIKQEVLDMLKDNNLASKDNINLIISNCKYEIEEI